MLDVLAKQFIKFLPSFNFQFLQSSETKKAAVDLSKSYC